jgi:hypothetical protein
MPAYGADRVGQSFDVSEEVHKPVSFVRESVDGNDCSARNELLACMELALFVEFRIAAPIESNGGYEPSVADVQANELSALSAAADYELIPSGRVANVFQLVLVLVRPKRVDVPEWCLVPHDRAPHGSTHLLSVVVVLHSDAAKERMEVIGNVTRGVDAVDIGATVRIDQHSVVESDGRPREQGDIRFDSGSDDREVAFELSPVPGNDEKLRSPFHFAGLVILDGRSLLDDQGRLRVQEIRSRLDRRLVRLPETAPARPFPGPAARSCGLGR